MYNKIVDFLKNKNIKMILASLVLFAGVMTFVPSASVLRSFPVLPVFSAAALIIYNDKKIICLLSFIFSFCMYCVYGFNLVQSILYGFVSAVITLLSAAIVMAFILARKSTKKSGLRTHRIRFIILVLVMLFVYFAVCSDPFSAITANSENRSYVVNSYGEKVEAINTYYSLSDLDFRTCIRFEDDGVRVGYDKEIYVNVSSLGIYDGVREYIEKKILESSEKAISSVLSTATDAYKVLYSDIVFSDGELVGFDASGESYYDRTNYVVGLYSVIDNKYDFERLVTDCVKSLVSASEDFDFESITFCAGNAEKALYSVSITPSTKVSEIKSHIHDFDSKNVELFGVTQNDFLKYWN